MVKSEFDDIEDDLDEFEVPEEALDQSASRQDYLKKLVYPDVFK